MNIGIRVGIALAAVALAVVAGALAPAPADDAAETGSHRVVFQVTSGGEEHWEGVLGNVENLRKALGPDQTEVEVVAHGKGLGFVLATNTGLRERMRELSEAGVVFAACENTMRKKGVTTDELLSLASTVDSGVAEVVRRQEQGWSYVKP